MTDTELAQNLYPVFDAAEDTAQLLRALATILRGYDATEQAKLVESILAPVRATEA